MKIADFNTKEKVFIVAEIGNNHEGSFTLAEELIGKAKECGVDAVKFQTFIPENFVSSLQTERLARLKKFQLSFQEFEKLSALANKLGILFFSTPLDLASADFLNTLCPVFKIASSDNNFYPLLEKVALTGKPLIISSGMSSIEDLKKTQSFISELWIKNEIKSELAFLHCVSNYPTTPENAHLKAIHTLKKELPKTTIGYSDHTSGVTASLVAASLGAEIIEKHFTIDKNFSSFRDHSLSADPEEMSLIVEKIRLTEVLLGNEEKIFQACEKDIAYEARRSISAASDLSEGHLISKKDLTWLRPGHDIPPGAENKILGARLKKPVLKGCPIKLEDLN